MRPSTQAANGLIVNFLRARILRFYYFHAHIALSLCGCITRSQRCVCECDCYDNCWVWDSADLLLEISPLRVVNLDFILPGIKAAFKEY